MMLLMNNVDDDDANVNVDGDRYDDDEDQW